MMNRTAFKGVFSCLHLAMMLVIFTKLPKATGTLCYGDSQFTQYVLGKTWTQARETCQRDFKGDLAKVDSLDTAKKLQENYIFGDIRWSSNRVGGQRGADGQFRWLDGTELPGDIFYRDNGVGLNCLRLYIPAPPTLPNLASIDCSMNEGFLCQRDKSPPVIKEGIEMISSTQQSITCKTDWCSPTWISEDGDDIPRCGEQSSRICQIISSTGSHLRFNNASEMDSGVYRCKTKNESSTFQSAIVKAIGKPKIITIETSSCTAIATLKWIADRYAINDIHIITLSDGQRFDVIARSSNTEQSLELKSLSDSTHYTLNITTCVETCFPLFNSSSTIKFTTKGRPNKVERIQSDFSDVAECSVTWTLPWTSTGVSKYKIQITASAIMHRSHSLYNLSWNTEVEMPLVKFKPTPNMKYTVAISAVNCGGDGQSAAVTANCSLPSAAPQSVPVPALIRTGSLLSPRMTILSPNESAGLISCILVIVTELPNESAISVPDGTYRSDEFSSLFSSNTTSNEYVAMTISPNSFASTKNTQFVVGENYESVCNISDTSTTDIPKINTCGGDVICGKNKPLRNLTRYRAYVIVAVPVETYVSVRRSQDVFFETIPEKDHTDSNDAIDTTTLIGTLVGVITLVVTVTVLVLITKRRSTKSNVPTSKARSTLGSSPVYEEPSLSTRSVAPASKQGYSPGGHSFYEQPSPSSMNTNNYENIPGSHLQRDNNEYECTNVQRINTTKHPEGEEKVHKQQQ